jgi:hypothetical protein
VYVDQETNRKEISTMAQEPTGWYTDPTGRYMYRYWNGTQWTDQVSSSGETLTDPNAMDPAVVATPPAPGSAAPTPPQATPPPTVQVSQKSGSSFGMILGVLLGIVAVIVLIVVLVSQSGGDSTETPETPVTTEAPATTTAP